jgi:hypothetical protein
MHVRTPVVVTHLSPSYVWTAKSVRMLNAEGGMLNSSIYFSI